MRRLILHAVIIGIAALFAVSARAQSLPAGSYRQSCRNIRVPAPSSMVAECQDIKGNWKLSYLTFTNCRGDIYNNNGALACAPSGKPDIGLPGGSWTDSCRNGNRRGSNLYAQCRTVAGKWRDAALDLSPCPQGPVGNNGGQLFCEGNTGRLPGGSWSQSCHNGRMTLGTLFAECRTLSGAWRQSALVLATCLGKGPVGNNDGRLFCEGTAGGPGRITLYQNSNFSGRSLSFTGPTPDLRLYNFGNVASSLSTQSLWYICTEPDYRGNCTTISGTLNLSPRWNDRISSLRPAS
jgi:hypothetical protein